MNGRPALLSTTTSKPIVQVKTLFYVGKTTQTHPTSREIYFSDVLEGICAYDLM